MARNLNRSARKMQSAMTKGTRRGSVQLKAGLHAWQCGVARDNSDKGSAMTAKELADYLDMTRQRVLQLTNEGVLPRTIDGTYPQHFARVAYIRFVRRRAASRAMTGNRTAGLIETKTMKAKLDLAIAQGEYVNIRDVEAAVSEAFAILRNEFVGLGASVTRDLQLRAEIDKKVNDRIARVRAALEAAGSAAFRDAAETD